MKRSLLYGLMINILFVLNLSAESEQFKGFRVKRFPFFIYSDAHHKLNHFYPGSMRGDFFHIKINDRYSHDPKVGKTCIRIQYTAEKKLGMGWAQISFQPTPSDYWNTKRGSYDLTTAKKLFFYAKGETGNEIVEFKMAGFNGKESSNKKVTTDEIRLTKKWKLYFIALDNVLLSEIIGGIAIIFSRERNPDKATIYMDQIYYSDKTTPDNFNSNNFSRSTAN